MQKYKFKAKLSYYLFYFGIWSILTIPMFLVYLKNPNYIEMLIVPAIIYLAVFISINSFVIEIREGKIIYKRFFYKKAEIIIKNIEELKLFIDFEIGHHYFFRGGTGSIFKLFFIGNKNSFIDLKCFSYDDISSIIKIISYENKSIKLDDLTNDLKEGNFEKIKKERIFYFLAFIVFLILYMLFRYLFDLIIK